MPGPGLRHPAAHGIGVAQIPVEPHKDAPVFVAVDFAFPHDHGGLGAAHVCQGSLAFRMHRGIVRHQDVTPAIGQIISLLPARSVIVGGVGMGGDKAQIGRPRSGHGLSRQCEPRPCRQGQHIALRLEAAILSALAIRPQGRHDLAAFQVKVIPRPIEAFDLPLRMACVADTVHFHPGVGFLEIVVGQPDRPGCDAPRRPPCPEMFLVSLVMAFVGVEIPCADAAVRVREIRQHHVMGARNMAEVIGDAMPLHHPAGEIHVGFAKLDRVFKRGVVGRRLDHQLAHVSIGRQQFLEDLNHGLVVKDALVAPQAGHPEPGL
jgi:hypothetical protein